MGEAGDAKEVEVSPYRMNLVPGEEQRRSQWNLIILSDVALTVDFYHTDMLEKVIRIRKPVPVAKEKEGEVIG